MCLRECVFEDVLYPSVRLASSAAVMFLCRPLSATIEGFEDLKREI